MTISLERRNKIFEWLDLPEPLRNPKSAAEFRHSIHLSARALKNLRIEWQIEREREKKAPLEIRGAMESIERGLRAPENIESDVIRWREVEREIYRKALDGSVSAQELYAKIKGKLIDKKEIKLSRLEDDEFYRLRNKAARELDKRGDTSPDRDREMRNKPSLLLEQSCVSTEQDNQEDDAVATVGLPRPSSDCVPDP